MESKNIFDLEQAISEWRKQMVAGGVRRSKVLDELESHLREDVARQLGSGANERQIFEVAVNQIGTAETIKMEFNKINRGNWNPPLAWTAWALFVISFFLPALAGFSQTSVSGWGCALTSAFYLLHPGETKSNWPFFHLAMLTFANLFMIASPFLLPKFSRNAVALNWLRGFSFSMLALVWSFIVLLLTHEDGSGLKIGCYVWASSFLLLLLATLVRREERKQYA